MVGYTTVQRNSRRRDQRFLLDEQAMNSQNSGQSEAEVLIFAQMDHIEDRPQTFDLHECVRGAESAGQDCSTGRSGALGRE